MKTINKMRAELLFNEYKSNDCAIVISDVIQRFMKHDPSYTENGVCQRKGCLSAKRESHKPLITLNTEVFDQNFDNLAQAILSNFPSAPQCGKCRQPLKNFERTFGVIIFIEVPGQNFEAGPEVADDGVGVEKQQKHKLKDLPEVLELECEENTHRYMLQGAIIFIPPHAATGRRFNDVGHYKCCVKLDESSWESFDDIEQKPKMMKTSNEIVIHSLFYVRINNV